MFARTQRLTLRPGWPEDADQLAAAIGHASVVSMLSRVPWPYTLDDAAWWLARDVARPELSLLVFAHEDERPALVGGVGLHPHDGGGMEIGYWLTPAAQGRGYATEAARAAVDMARHALGLDGLIGRHRLDNPASGRVLQKLGFRPSGTGEMPCLATGGGPVPCATYALDLRQPPALAAAA